MLRLAQSLNRPAPLDLRANPSRSTATRLSKSSGPTASPARRALLAAGGAPEGKPALQKHPLFLDGSFEVQDEGSQLLGFLLQPKRGEMVVDFCAGAGGKTLLLGALMRNTGRLYAFDVSDKRLGKLKPRWPARASNIHPVVIASENDPRVKRLAGKIDRVLVDAPCSGLGTLRRNPDLKWRQSPEALAELTGKQAAIPASAARPREAGRPPGVRHLQPAARGERGHRRRLPGRQPAFAPVSAEEVLAKQGIAIACGEQLHLSPAGHDTTASSPRCWSARPDAGRPCGGGGRGARRVGGRRPGRAAGGWPGEAPTGAVPARGSVRSPSPWNDPEAALIAAIAEARERILVQAYVFHQQAHRPRAGRRPPARRARRGAARRRDEPPVVAQRAAPAAGGGHPGGGGDPPQHRPQQGDDLRPGLGQPCAVATGSYNFTCSARVANAENLLILRGNPALVRTYTDNWQRHRAEAQLLRSLDELPPRRGKTDGRESDRRTPD